ncbi:MAG: cell wall anchor protein, partial [Bdellovibrio sp. ArHS]
MKYGTSFLIMLFSILASAAPSSLNYQGRILKTDGSPLSASNVSFSFEITNSDESCVMYREQLNGVDLSTTKGVFDVAVGTGVKQFPLAPSFKLSDAFVDGKSISCDGAAPVTPAIGSSRKLRVQFYEGSTWRSITPAMEIHSVPFAISAAQLDGKEASEFVIKTGLPTCAAGTFLSWDGTALTCQGTVGAGGGTVTSVTSADSYITVTSSTLAPVLQLNVGTT